MKHTTRILLTFVFLCCAGSLWLGTPKNGWALSSNPATLSGCTGETGTAIAAYVKADSLVNLSGPPGAIETTLLGTLLGTAQTQITPALSVMLNAIYCEEDSVQEAIMNVQKAISELGKTVVLGQQLQSTTTGSYTAAKYKNRFGTAQLPAGACDAVYVARRTGGTVSQAAMTSLAASAVTEAYNRATPATMVSLGVQAHQTPESLSTTALFGAGDLAAGGAAHNVLVGEQFTVNATNPVPAHPMSMQELSQPGSGARMAAYNMSVADTAIAQKPFNDLLALHTPNPAINSAIWSNGVLNATGITPIQSTGSAGTTPSGLSTMQVLSQSVAARFSNPTYVQDVLVRGKTNALRQMAVSQAVQLEIEYQQLIAEQNEEVVLGAILGRMTNGRRVGTP